MGRRISDPKQKENQEPRRCLLCGPPGLIFNAHIHIDIHIDIAVTI